MNVSVPDEIRKRMEKVREPVNWSAVATEAFIKKLGEIAAAKEKKDMSAVIDRLRASKIEATSATGKEGYAAGRQWAMHAAGYGELEGIARFASETDSVADVRWNAPWAAMDYAAMAALGIDEKDRQNRNDSDIREDIESFWDDNFTRAGDDDWLDGFLAGASAVWEEVRAEL